MKFDVIEALRALESACDGEYPVVLCRRRPDQRIAIRATVARLERVFLFEEDDNDSIDEANAAFQDFVENLTEMNKP